MNEILITFGGSNRKYSKQWAILAPIAHNLPMRKGIGSKMFDFRADDTPENREIAKQAGATVKVRKQQPQRLF